MKFSRDFIDKLKKSTDIVELISEYTELKKIGRFMWSGKCPHPDHDDSTASLIVYTNYQSWCCFGCHSDKKNTDNKSHKNYGSDCIAFIQWINNGKLSWKECVELLAKRIDLPLPVDANEKEYQRNLRLNSKYMKDMTPEVRAYCTRRGLNRNDLIKFNIGYDKVENRITFPMFDMYNNIVGFNKRRIDDSQERKYINPPNSNVFNKSTYLYNINNIDKEYKYVYIAEGVFDVILASKFGLKNVVCTLGSSFTSGHYDIINKLDLTPVLLYDGDDKGRASVRSAIDLIYEKGSYPLIYNLPDGYDLADFSLEIQTDLVDTVEQGMVTYGYLKAEDMIVNYLNELYKLKAKYRPQVDNIMNLVPEQERNNIRLFISNEIRM